MDQSQLRSLSSLQQALRYLSKELVAEGSKVLPPTGGVEESVACGRWMQPPHWELVEESVAVVGELVEEATGGVLAEELVVAVGSAPSTVSVGVDGSTVSVGVDGSEASGSW